jgi:hypothetical protein
MGYVVVSLLTFVLLLTSMLFAFLNLPDKFGEGTRAYEISCFGIGASIVVLELCFFAYVSSSAAK